MTNPLVSVLMAVHNGGHYLREAVDSILCQTMEDFEFIIVDDGSKDDSLRILESYNDHRLHIIRQPNNQGLVVALNLAAKAATAPLLARMDADDIALPERLSVQTATFDSQPELVLLGTAYNIIDSEGHVVGVQSLPRDDAEIRLGLLEGNKFAHPTIMMRSVVFHACGGYRDIGGKYAQDYDLWLRLAEKGHLGNLEDALLHYRVHGKQISIDKIFLQRQASELYRQLAIQRRTLGYEDLDLAKFVVDRMRKHLQALCAAELLRLSGQFAADGNLKEARLLHWRAFLMAPLCQPIRASFTAALQRRWLCMVGQR